MNETASRIKKILKHRLRVDPAAVDQCALDTPLLGKGIGLDSVESLNLAAGIEAEFGMIIADDDLSVKIFATLGALVEFVEAKRAASNPAS